MKPENVELQPQVDVLIITYNQENYIAEAIEGAVNQTYQNVKVIVADDCSTDGTREIVDQCYERYPEKIVRVYNKSNLGITGNSNAGLAVCSGDYFVIMGGDDVLYADKIEKQVEWFRGNPNKYLCGHALDIINENSKVTGNYKVSSTNGAGARNWIRKGMLYGCMSIMIRNLPNLIEPFDDRLIYSSDLKFFIDFLGTKHKYGAIDCVLGAYRKSDTSITVSKWHECVNDSKIMYNILEKEADSTHSYNIKFGRNYLMNYGIALRAFEDRDFSSAINGFYRTILCVPYFGKAYIRLIQSLIFLFLKRNEKD